ncbi:uncharacterized protein [Drosophila bipectinata]|uniref:uncharacterized protein n=1 Tax=Drosophila bipectinata TaxID=42026 RepID=UPI0038B41820
MVTAKLLLREIWRKGVNCDEPLPDELAAAFEDWRQGMSRIQEFRCPRHYTLGNLPSFCGINGKFPSVHYFGGGRVRTLQLHIFVDSSQSAFAAAAYWRATYENGDVQAHFISSKTKCAPMRTMSIPRLELQAAVLGTRLMDTVKQEHGVAISSCALWTDSKTVLHWISNTHRRYKQFVGNRVAEILESTEASQWRWIPSAENVARDKAAQGRGPEHQFAMAKRTAVSTKTRGELAEIERGLDSSDDRRRGNEIARIDTAVAARNVAKDSRLDGLSPYLDEDGVLRASGRIDDATCVPYNARRPIILSHEEALAEMIVQQHHEKMCHQNAEATIGSIRSKFWITNLRRLLRRVVSKCNVCKLRKARPLEMAHDLSTDSCIIAMRNFMSRRGPVVRIRSDNGKNFVGADREAKRFSEVFEPAQIQGELSSKGVEWIFNCPANPAEGGAWERMVQCVKKVLAHTMKELEPMEHVLENLLIEAESIVNSRPLTHLPVTVDQEAPLTPNDLLKGASDIPDLPKDDGQEPV